MNIVANTTAWPSLNSTAGSVATSSNPASDVGTAVALTAPAAAPAQGPHHHHHEQDDDGDEHSGHHDQQAYMELKLQVEQTFSALTAPSAGAAATGTSAPSTEGEDGGGFAAMLKAKFSMSEGGMSASLSIRMSAEGQAAGGDLAAQMQGFVQTLYAALHTLFGGSPATPNATAGTPVSTGAAAALTGAPSSTGKGGAISVAPSAATSAPSGTTATANPLAPATAPAGAPGATTAGGAGAAPSGEASLSLKLRLTYSSFGSQLGTLTQQLAQPGAAQAAPGMGDLMGDLSTRFGQLLAASGSSNSPSLGDFLNGLAQAFATPTPKPASTSTPPAAGPVAASGSTTTPATAPAGSASPYGQVLSFSASLRTTWQLAA